MSWYLAVLRKYAVFTGRARRKEYWMFVLCNFLITVMLVFVLGFAGELLGLGGKLSDAGSVAYALAIFVPAFAVAVRRMHDLGRSGWWMVVPVANLVFLCLGGQAGENEFGPDPKAESEPD